MTRVVAIRHVAFEDLGSFAQLFEQRGFILETLDAGVDDLSAIARTPPDLLVVLGGPLSVNDDAIFPFLAQEKALVREWLQRGRPCLGLCLGAQLMSVALGGTVTGMAQKEIGWGPLTLTREGAHSALGVLGASSTVLHWHGETFSLPEGAVLLAKSPLCENQAFAWGDHALGLQFHVEASGRALERWFIGHIGELMQNGIDVNALRSETLRHSPTIEERSQAFLARWLAERGL